MTAVSSPPLGTARGLVGVRLLLLGCVVVWGWTFVAMKVLLEFMDPVELVGLRFGLGLPLLYAVVRLNGLSLAVPPRDRRPLLLGAALICFHFLVQPLGVHLTTATNTGWIIAVTPLVIAALSAWLLRETVTKAQLLGILIASAGILVLIVGSSRGGGSGSGVTWFGSVGDWLILATAFSWALYTIATRDLARRRASLAVTFLVFVPLTVLALGYAAVHSGPALLARLSWQAWVALLFLATLGTLAQWGWQVGVARLGAAKAGIFLYLEPLATTALAVPLLRERLLLTTAVGGAMALFGVYWAEREALLRLRARLSAD